MLTDDSDPAFAPGGEYLYFASSRHFQPRLGGYDLKPHWTEQDGLYLVVLAADGDHPFPPQSDEVAFESDVDGDEDGDTDTDEDADEDDDGEDGDDADEDDDVPPVRIDLEGLGDRIVELDVEPGNYSSLAATEGHLFYMSAPAEAEHRALRVFVMEDREAEDVLAPCDGYDLSADGGENCSTPPRGAGASSPPRRARSPPTSPCAPARCAPAACRRPSGPRCSRTPGASRAISSTTPVCTASTGTACTNATAGSCPT